MDIINALYATENMMKIEKEKEKTGIQTNFFDEYLELHEQLGEDEQFALEKLFRKIDKYVEEERLTGYRLGIKRGIALAKEFLFEENDEDRSKTKQKWRHHVRVEKRIGQVRDEKNGATMYALNKKERENPLFHHFLMKKL